MNWLNNAYGKGKTFFGLVLVVGSFFITNLKFDLTAESQSLVEALGSLVGGATMIYGIVDKIKRKINGE